MPQAHTSWGQVIKQLLAVLQLRSAKRSACSLYPVPLDTPTPTYPPTCPVSKLQRREAEERRDAEERREAEMQDALEPFGRMLPIPENKVA